MMPAKHRMRRADVAWAFAYVALAVFTALHGVHQVSAIGCSAACDPAPRYAHLAPISVAIAWVLVLAPLARNAALVLRNAPSLWSGLIGRSLRPTLRSLVDGAGVGALLFGVFHALELRSAGLSTPFGAATVPVRIAAEMSSTTGGLPLVAIAYLIGTACVCLFVIGKLSVWLATGLAACRPAVRKAAAWGMTAAGAVLWACFADVIVFHATGAPLVSPGSMVDVAPGQCR
jgi:hypothetical protein